MIALQPQTSNSLLFFPFLLNQFLYTFCIGSFAAIYCATCVDFCSFTSTIGLVAWVSILQEPIVWLFLTCHGTLATTLKLSAGFTLNPFCHRRIQQAAAMKCIILPFLSIRLFVYWFVCSQFSNSVYAYLWILLLNMTHDPKSRTHLIYK